MTIKDQWKTIKNNWIIIAGILLLVIVLSLGGAGRISYSAKSLAAPGSAGSNYGSSYDMADYATSQRYVSTIDAGFSPGITERKLTKSASLFTEVEKGDFSAAQQRLKDVVSSSNSYILSENVNKYETQRQEYFQGSYSIKVDTKKYDAVVSQLKEIGEVQSFSEYTYDVTEQYDNLETNLEVEKARLQRYQGMYSEAKEVEDKINLNDRIFDQERTIKYLEESMTDVDERIEYTTISFSLAEKRSGYAGVVFVKFSSLIENFVDSLNALLSFIFMIIPWVVLILLGVLGWKLLRRKNDGKRH